jgi:hypothetical protein
LHSKVELVSFDLKASLAVVARVISLGPLTIKVLGGALSTGGGGEATVEPPTAGVAVAVASVGFGAVGSDGGR